MSVFKTIKGTFAAGLKSFTSREPIKEDQTKYTKSGVNVDAGADLLHKYQIIWKELHDKSEENARYAEDVDGMITSMYVNYDRQCETMEKLHEAVAALPVILTQLQELTDVLANLEEEYDKVEASMVRLENLTEEQEYMKTKNLHIQKLAQYDQGKRHELEKVKVQLAKDHARHMQQYDKIHQTQLKERQETFQEKFDEDVNYFKTHGHMNPERLSTGSADSGKKPDISEIEIDADQDKLDEFLASADADAMNENLISSEGTLDEVFSEEDLTKLVIKDDEDIPDVENIPDQSTVKDNSGESIDKEKSEVKVDDTGSQAVEQTITDQSS